MNAASSFPLPKGASSRGFAQTPDYVWVVGDRILKELDGVANPLLEKLRTLMPQSCPGILIAATSGNSRSFAVFLCNFKASRIDFRNRSIRNSLAWENLTEPEARTLALWALDNWASVESELSQVFVASDVDPGWRVDWDKLRSWLASLQNKTSAASDSPSEQQKKRWWLSYGEPGSSSWQSAAQKFRAENLLHSDSWLAFIISKDPNHEAYDLLRSEAGCLITDGGPDSWMELTGTRTSSLGSGPMLVKKRFEQLRTWIKPHLPLALAFATGVILAITILNGQLKKKVEQAESRKDQAVKDAVEDSKKQLQAGFVTTLVEENKKAVEDTKKELQAEFGTTLAEETKKAVEDTKKQLQAEFGTTLAKETKKAVEDTKKQLQTEFGTTLAKETKKAVEDTKKQLGEETEIKKDQKFWERIDDAFKRAETKQMEKDAEFAINKEFKDEFKKALKESLKKEKPKGPSNNKPAVSHREDESVSALHDRVAHRAPRAVAVLWNPPSLDVAICVSRTRTPR